MADTPETRAKATEPTIDRRGLAVLNLETCVRRLDSAVIGRVGLLDRGEVLILPVNHVLDGTTVGFFTTTGAKLAHALDGSRVAFEVDGVDEEARTGWSVLVQGTAAIAEDQVAERLSRKADRSWLPARGGQWVVIHAAEISGREIFADPEGMDAERRSGHRG